MLTTDQTSAAIVPTLTPGVRASGRRRAVETAPVGATISGEVSPRRAARAAREAAAAAELSSAASSTFGLEAPAPTSPLVGPLATDLSEPAPAAEVRSSFSASPAVVATPTSPEGDSAVLSGSFGLPGLAASVPTPASPTGRRHTFVPAQPVVRRREAATPAARRSVAARPTAAETRAPAAARSRRGTAVVVARRGAMLGVVCGILATSILPVLNANQSKAYAAGTGVAYTAPSSASGQNYRVAANVTDTVSARDGYGATSVIDYEQQVIDNRLAQTNTTYTGPTAADYLVHPLFAHLDRAEVFQVALQYLGTPYVHGGADPSAFDCSGLIMFVYAQFGIALPHYVPSQDAMGTTIPQSEAVPGDLVVFDNDAHDGIYAGNDMILDAPKPGGHVSVRPIWNQAHHFVRIAG
jgi:cell wall-associated NlpC family hydrolase